MASSRLKFLPGGRRGQVAVVACLVSVVALLVGLLLRKGNAADVAGQPLRTFKGQGFSVDLPCTPKKNTQTAQTPNGPLTLLKYACAGGTDGYSISTTTSQALVGLKIDPNTTATGAAANFSGTAHDVRSTTYLGNQAVDFRVPDAKSGSGKVTVFARALYVGPTVYLLEYLKQGNDIAAPPASYQAFLDSLRLG